MVKISLIEIGYDQALSDCQKFHYSKSCPQSSSFRYGVIEDGIAVGSIILGNGANKNYSRRLGMKPNEVIELQRVALGSHKFFVTQAISMVIRKMKSLGYKAIISYCDKDQGHSGTIYRAGNWFYDGYVRNQSYVINGKKLHPRTVSTRYGTRSLKYIRENIDPSASYKENKNKDRYIYFLTRHHKNEYLKMYYQSKKGK